MVHVRNASAVILKQPEGKIPLGLVYMEEYYYSWSQRYVLADLVQVKIQWWVLVKSMLTV
jgi:hypothetical protein